MTKRGEAANLKFEYRNPKQIQRLKEENPKQAGLYVLIIGILNFDIVSDFEIRISDFVRDVRNNHEERLYDP